MMVVVVVHSEDMMPSEDILKHFLKKLTKWTKKCDKKHGGCFDDVRDYFVFSKRSFINHLYNLYLETGLRIRS